MSLWVNEVLVSFQHDVEKAIDCGADNSSECCEAGHRDQESRELLEEVLEKEDKLFIEVSFIVHFFRNVKEVPEGLAGGEFLGSGFGAFPFDCGQDPCEDASLPVLILGFLLRLGWFVRGSLQADRNDEPHMQIDPINADEEDVGDAKGGNVVVIPLDIDSFGCGKLVDGDPCEDASAEGEPNDQDEDFARF